MYDVRVLCPASLRTDSHVRDAALWVWVERQDVATLEDIRVSKDESNDQLVVEFVFADCVPDAACVGRLLVAFAAAFPQ